MWIRVPPELHTYPCGQTGKVTLLKIKGSADSSSARGTMKYICDKNRHLVCIPYSIDNLHAMADELLIKRCWYHGGDKPHYDIPKKRIEEIEEKCEIVSSKEIYKIIKNEN